jgi:hypothetical protein
MSSHIITWASPNYEIEAFIPLFQLKELFLFKNLHVIKSLIWMSTLSLGFPPSHYVMMNAFIDFTTNHNLNLDAKLIEGNLSTPYA